MTYELRYFFDPGSGICLWAKSDDAIERYGYAVEHWELPLSENTRRWLDYVIAWFDTSMDWESHSVSDDAWDSEEERRFRTAVLKGLEMLRHELPEPDFVIIDESKI